MLRMKGDLHVLVQVCAVDPLPCSLGISLQANEKICITSSTLQEPLDRMNWKNTKHSEAQDLCLGNIEQQQGSLLSSNSGKPNKADETSCVSLFPLNSYIHLLAGHLGSLWGDGRLLIVFVNV